ncbi:MAG: hypothetical protein WA766_05740 [Candidatus Acidiferrales bacterium]
MSTTPTPASRIQAAQKQMQGQSVICGRCGSTYLRRVSVTTYRAGGYGTVSIQEDTDAQPFDILICVCGYPVTPKPEIGRRAQGIREQGQKEFLESIKRAKEYLDTVDPTTVGDALKDVVAGKYVEGRVETLTDQVNALTAEKETAAHEDHESRKHSKAGKSENDDSTT